MLIRFCSKNRYPIFQTHRLIMWHFLWVLERTIPESNVGWPNVGPTSVLASRRWPNISPTYIAVLDVWRLSWVVCLFLAAMALRVTSTSRGRRWRSWMCWLTICSSTCCAPPTPPVSWCQRRTMTSSRSSRNEQWVTTMLLWVMSVRLFIVHLTAT